MWRNTMTLSDKIYNGTHSEIPRVSVKDVKEFIKKLKEDLLNELKQREREVILTSKGCRIEINPIIKRIDKLAGDDLI